MADIKVRDLTDTSSIDLQNQIMVLTNDENNQVQNITVENLLSNVLSSDNGNVLEQGTDGKLYVETPENITGELADLDTVNKTSLVNSINEVVSNLSTEATTRANADNNLQSQIDAITSASDVTDIVGTYAQLQAYDTTGLPDNSIIKVLQDESRQDETTYYRWVITGGVGAWVLIGEEGPYYTKSQADSLFATQQTTGNLASLDTSDKTSLVNAINELSSVLDPTQTADYINNSKAVESGAISSNSIILSDVIKYAHSSFDLSKFTVAGSPNITDDGILINPASSTSNHVDVTDMFNIWDAKTWSIETPFVKLYNDTPNNDNYIFRYLSSINGKDNGINLALTPAGRVTFTAAYNGYAQIGVDYDKCIDNIPNYDRTIEYQFKCECTSTNYNIYYRTKQSNWSLLATISKNGSLQAITRRMNIGYFSTATWAFHGDLDLKYLSVKTDGVEVFSGNKTGIDTIKPDDYTVVGTPTISSDGIASGFSQSNYLTAPNALSNFANAVTDFDFYVPFKLSNYPVSRELVVRGQYDTSFRFLIAIDPNKTTKFSFSTLDSEITVIPATDLELNVGYIIKISLHQGGLKYGYYKNNTYTETGSREISSIDAMNWLRIGSGNSYYGFIDGSIDLNSFKIYVDGNLVYQPCLKIPYMKGSEQYGGKYVNAQYLPRVKDAYEQGLANDYFTLDEANGTYTLPMGNLYGMIEKLNQLAKDEIGLPKVTLSNTLNDNEIWLEGAEVSKLTYSKLYAIYGDDYGTPTDSANFVLPDCRDRVMQGIGSGGTFGYISAGLPNITGSFGSVNQYGNTYWNGAFRQGVRNDFDTPTGNGMSPYQVTFDASRSNSIYGNSTTVQPPAIKVRFKTRFQ